jgi:hypothetical protein
MIHPGVGQTNGVQHATVELGHARGRISAAGLERYRLGDDTPEPVEIDHAIELRPEARRSRREENGVSESPSEGFADETRLFH